MPLPIITPYEFPALAALATGPFSYRYTPSAAIRLGVPVIGTSVIAMTDYPLPDGGWNWGTCLAENWTPDLFQLPAQK